MMSVEDEAFPVYDRAAYERDVVEFDRLWARNTTPDECRRMDRLVARMVNFETRVRAYGDPIADRSVAAVF